MRSSSIQRSTQTVLERLATTLAECTTLREATWRSIEGFAGFDEEVAKLLRALNFDVPLSWSMAELVPVLDASMDLIATHLTRFLPELSDVEVQRHVFYSVGFVRGAVMMRLLRPERAPEREAMLRTLSETAYQIALGQFPPPRSRPRKQKMRERGWAILPAQLGHFPTRTTTLVPPIQSATAVSRGKD